MKIQQDDIDFPFCVFSTGLELLGDFLEDHLLLLELRRNFYQAPAFEESQQHLLTECIRFYPRR